MPLDRSRLNAHKQAAQEKAAANLVSPLMTFDQGQHLIALIPFGMFYQSVEDGRPVPDYLEIEACDIGLGRTTINTNRGSNPIFEDPDYQAALKRENKFVPVTNVVEDILIPRINAGTDPKAKRNAKPKSFFLWALVEVAKRTNEDMPWMPELRRVQYCVAKFGKSQVHVHDSFLKHLAQSKGKAFDLLEGAQLVVITRTGSGTSTRYTSAKAPEEVELFPGISADRVQRILGLNEPKINGQKFIWTDELVKMVEDATVPGADCNLYDCAAGFFTPSPDEWTREQTAEQKGLGLPRELIYGEGQDGDDAGSDAAGDVEQRMRTKGRKRAN